MNEGKALMRREDPIRLGEVLAESGYFTDAKDAAQAAVKVMAGQELGFGPIASMTGIHIIEGKPALGANMLAALVRRHPEYDYRVTELTNEKCSLTFSYRGDDLEPPSEFSFEDARRIKWYDKKKGDWRPLTDKGPWRFYPRNMLFARAMSNGVTFHCPDLCAGAPVYTPEELGGDVQEDSGEFAYQAGQAEEQEPISEADALRLKGLIASLPDEKQEFVPSKLRSMDAETVDDLASGDVGEFEAWLTTLHVTIDKAEARG